jgi:hypothetical protein
MLMWLFPFSFNPTLSCPCNDQTSTQSSKVGHDRFRLIWPDWSFSRATRFQIQHISRLSLRRILNLFSEVLATPMLAVTYGPKKFSCHHPCIILARISQITHITLKALSCYRLRTYRACRHQSPDARPLAPSRVPAPLRYNKALLQSELQARLMRLSGF